MIFIKRMAILIYVTLMLFISCGLLLFSLHRLELNYVLNLWYAIYIDQNLRMAIGILSGVLLSINLIFYQYFSVNVHREKIIAFDNPSGRVTVSLRAVEDLIQRILTRLPEVQSVRPDVRASKKGLNISLRLTLFSEVSIPDITVKVQNLVTKKVQETIGVDDPIRVAVYVNKITSESPKGKGPQDKEKTEDKYEWNIPFHGYRA